jgi:eukaryotic-like serine/threonine-protein kinase
VTTTDPRYDEAMGRTMLLAGRTEEAVGPLRRAARMCAALEWPMVVGRARLLLGQGLEARGDKEGACAAYGDVIRWWGNAKPRSLSGEKAKERSKKLGCEVGTK